MFLQNQITPQSSYFKPQNNSSNLNFSVDRIFSNNSQKIPADNRSAHSKNSLNIRSGNQPRKISQTFSDFERDLYGN